MSKRVRTSKKKQFNLLGILYSIVECICADWANVYAKCFIHHFDIEYIIIRWWFRWGPWLMAHVSSRQREHKCDLIISIEKLYAYILKRLDCGFYGFYWIYILVELCHADRPEKKTRKDVDNDDEKMANPREKKTNSQ